jgi:hypothetical protein
VGQRDLKNIIRSRGVEYAITEAHAPALAYALAAAHVPGFLAKELFGYSFVKCHKTMMKFW